MALCRFVFLVIFIICHSYSLCFAEEDSLQSYSLDEIEKDLQSQISISDVEQIKREDLPKLEDKKKESISSEIDVSHENEAFSYTKNAKIIILNKITAKSELVEFKLGEAKSFGNISVELNRCAKNTDPLKSSNLMLIKVLDKKFNNDKSVLFNGWMDSSNLSISTLEHPVYEIIPIDCIK